MARKYKRLSYDDRRGIEAMCKSGRRTVEIAEEVGAHRANYLQRA